MSQSEKSRRQASEIRYYKNHDILFHIHRGIDKSVSVGIKSMALPLFYLRNECNNPATDNHIIYHTQCRFIVSIYQDEKRGNLSCILQLQWVWDTLRTLDSKDVLRRKFIQSYLF